MKSIVVLTNKYPNKYDKNVLVFVQQLVWEFANQGIDVTVIVPSPVNIRLQLMKLPTYSEEVTDLGKVVKIYRPGYIGFGQSNILGFNPAKITTRNYTNAVKRVIKKYKLDFDLLYSHFITPAGIAASRLGKYYGKPSFMAHGEATTMTIEHFGKKAASKELRKLTGIIAVSNDNKDMLVELLNLDPNKIGVFPNGFNPNRFYPRDSVVSREILGLPKDKFIVSFVGSFDERKGIKRLENAIEQLDDVYFIAAGQGKLIPQSEKCLFYGSVPNDELPIFYSASDVFVLPTRNEGSCNAIIEAKACGIPVISSVRSFNDDIIDESNSIRVDENSIDEIANAIDILRKNNILRTTLVNNLKMQCKFHSIETRARNILMFFDKLCGLCGDLDE